MEKRPSGTYWTIKDVQSELFRLYAGKFENNAVYRCPYDGCDAILTTDQIERHIQEQCEAAYKNCAN